MDNEWLGLVWNLKTQQYEYLFYNENELYKHLY